MTALSPVHTIGIQLREAIRHSGVRVDGANVPAPSNCSTRSTSPPGPSNSTKYPHQLSGGMLQRVLIAGGPRRRPELIVADEPTSALDVTVQASILDLLLELQERTGVGMLMITHDLGVARLMSDRIYVMKQGRFVEGGNADALLGNAQSPYTKRLLDAVPRLDGHPGIRGPRMTEPHASASKTSSSNTPSPAECSAPWTRSASRSTRARCLAVVGESGCGKSTIGQVDRAAGDVPPRAGSASTASTSRRCPNASCALPLPDPDGVPGPLRLAGPTPDRRRHRRRTACGSRGVRSRTERTTRAAELIDRVGLPTTALHRKPGRVLRRTAAAHRHRPRAGERTRTAGLRRGHQRARRLRAGAGARPAARDPGTTPA